jgi:flagellar hook-associated protein FlgK
MTYRHNLVSSIPTAAAIIVEEQRDRQYHITSKSSITLFNLLNERGFRQQNTSATTNSLTTRQPRQAITIWLC